MRSGEVSGKGDFVVVVVGEAVVPTGGAGGSFLHPVFALGDAVGAVAVAGVYDGTHLVEHFVTQVPVGFVGVGG